MSRPRVLHVSSDVAIYGAGRHLLTLLSQPAMKDFELHVAAPEGPLGDAVRGLSVPVHPLSQGDRSLSPGLVRELLAVITQLRPDVVHTHASLAGRIAARLSGVPRRFYTKHGLTVGGHPAVNRLLSLGLGDRVFAISEAVRSHLVRSGVPASRITVIPNGIEPPVPDPNAVRAIRASVPGRRLVGTVGRLAPEKAFDVFVRAAGILAAIHGDVSFAIVGEGPEREALERLIAESGLQGRVVLAGYQSRPADWMAASDVSVLPSRSEGQGLVLLEAMSVGRPVVATAVGGIPEVVRDGENGLLVPPENPQALAQAISRLLEDDDLARRLGEQAAADVEIRFSAEAMAESLAAAYRSGEGGHR